MARNEFKCDCSSVNQQTVDFARSKLERMEVFDELSKFFKTFGDQTRLKIICVLDHCLEMCVCDICVALSMTKSAVSHQLRFLRSARLVKSRKVGKEVFYSLSDDHVKLIYEQGIAHLKENEHEERI